MGKENDASQVRTSHALPLAEADVKKHILDLAASNLAQKFGTPEEQANLIYKDARFAPTNDIHAAIKDLVLKHLSPSQRKSVLRKENEKRQHEKGRDLQVKYDRSIKDLVIKTRQSMIADIEKSNLTADQKESFKKAKTPDEALRALGQGVNVPDAPIDNTWNGDRFTRDTRARQYASELAAWNNSPQNLDQLQTEFISRINNNKIKLFEKHPEYAYVDPSEAQKAATDPSYLRKALQRKFGTPDSTIEGGYRYPNKPEYLNALKDYNELYKMSPEDRNSPQAHELLKRMPLDAAPLVRDFLNNKAARQKLGLEPKPFSLEDDSDSEEGSPNYSYGNVELQKIKNSLMRDPKNYLRPPRPLSPQESRDMEFKMGQIKSELGRNAPDWLVHNKGLAQIFPELHEQGNKIQQQADAKLDHMESLFPSGIELNQPANPQITALERAQAQDVPHVMQPDLEGANAPLVESEAYNSYLNSPRMQEMIKDLKAQHDEHFEKKILPGINMSFIKSGAFHGTGRNEAIQEALKNNNESFHRAWLGLTHKLHSEGMQSAHQQRNRQLETASQRAQAAVQERAGNLAVAQGHDNQQKGNIALDAAKSMLLGSQAAQQQQQDQEVLNQKRAQFIEAQNNPIHGIQQLANIHQGLPSAGVNTATEATLPNAAKINYPGLIAGSAGSLLAPDGPPKQQARGGRTLRRAPGGAIPNQPAADPSALPIFNTPEMQAIKGSQQDYHPQRGTEDPRWNYVRRVSAELLKDPRGDPMAAIGRGMEAGNNDIRSDEATKREQAIAIAQKMQESKQKQHETLLEYHDRAVQRAETARHNQGMEGIHGGQLAESKRHNDSTVEENRLKREDLSKYRSLLLAQKGVKRKPTSADTQLRKRLNDQSTTRDDLIKAYEQVLDLGDKTTTGGAFESYAPKSMKNAFTQALVHNGEAADYDMLGQGLNTIPILSGRLYPAGPGGARTTEQNERAKLTNASTAEAREKLYRPALEQEKLARERHKFTDEGEKMGLNTNEAYLYWDDYMTAKQDYPKLTPREFFRRTANILDDPQSSASFGVDQSEMAHPHSAASHEEHPGSAASSAESVETDLSKMSIPQMMAMLKSLKKG